MAENRPRGKSAGESELFNGDISVEDLTVMKLMEEIMEFDQEIKMKQRWINTRMKMLHKILPGQKAGSQTALLIEKFMCALQPEYPNKISVTYERPGLSSEAIPMPMNPIPMGQADVYKEPIQMRAQCDPATSSTTEEQKEQ